MAEYSYQTIGDIAEIKLNRSFFSDDFIDKILIKIKLELISNKNKPEVPQAFVDNFVEQIHSAWWNENRDEYLQKFIL